MVRLVEVLTVVGSLAFERELIEVAVRGADPGTL